MLFDHIDMRVRCLRDALPLYDALLPAMGFTKRNADEESVGYHRPDETGAEPFFWVLEDAEHVPGATRFAFSAGDRAEVDRLAKLVHEAGARAFEAPELITEYGPNYYAAFFEDATGNKIEICCRKRQ